MPRRRRSRLTEAVEQQILVRWLRSRGVMFFSVPNEARRSPALGAKLKAMGMTAGVPDLVLVTPPRVESGPLVVCVELKAAHRRTERHGGCSPEQLAWHRAARMLRWDTYVCYGAQDAISTLTQLGY